MKFWLLALMSITTLACTKSHTLSDVNQIEGLSAPNIAKMNRVSERQFQIKDSPGVEYVFQNKETFLTIKKIQNAHDNNFEQAVRLREFELERPFREERSPYPGALTASVRCPESFRPKITADKIHFYWRSEVAVSKRKTPICSDADFSLKSVEVIFFCPKQNLLFIISGTFPKESSDLDWSSWLSDTRCAS